MNSRRALRGPLVVLIVIAGRLWWCRV